MPEHGRRPLLAASGRAALLALWIRAKVPTSPRYLVAAGREAEARGAGRRHSVDLCAAWLVERWGRRPTLVTFLAASGAFTLFAVVESTAAIVVSACLMSFFSLGASLGAGSLGLALGIFGAAFLMGAAAVAALGRETRGRPLEDALAPV